MMSMCSLTLTRFPSRIVFIWLFDANQVLFWRVTHDTHATSNNAKAVRALHVEDEMSGALRALFYNLLMWFVKRVLFLFYFTPEHSSVGWGDAGVCYLHILGPNRCSCLKTKMYTFAPVLFCLHVCCLFVCFVGSLVGFVAPHCFLWQGRRTDSLLCPWGRCFFILCWRLCTELFHNK